MVAFPVVAITVTTEPTPITVANAKALTRFTGVFTNFKNLCSFFSVFFILALLHAYDSMEKKLHFVKMHILPLVFGLLRCLLLYSLFFHMSNKK